MVSTFTTARGLEKPAAGDQVGTWGTATVNPNMDVVDASLAQSGTVSVTAGNVALTATQCRNARIVLSSTLTGSITVTFLTSINGPYTILNSATGSSAFTITLNTTAAGGRAIGCPPGMFDIWNDGANIDFRNADRIGTYVDHAGSSVPNWNSACTVPPLLNCDGSAFSSATYPYLQLYLGGTTLPDLRGRYRAYLNQGTGRLTSSQGGVDGNTTSASGGSQATLISSAHLPSTALNEPSSGHTHAFSPTIVLTNGGTFLAGGGIDREAPAVISPALTGITFGTSSPTAFPLLPPTAIGGITMIRAN